MASDPYSLAFEVAATIPATGEQVTAFDVLHETRREAQVVDDQGRVVAGSQVSVSYVTLGPLSDGTTREGQVYDGAGRLTGFAEVAADSVLFDAEIGGLVEMRVRMPTLPAEDITAGPLLVGATSYWMDTAMAQRSCDRYERRDIPVEVVSLELEGMDPFGITVRPSETQSATATSASTTVAPSTVAATTVPPTTAPRAEAAADGTDLPAPLLMFLSVLSTMGLLGLFWWWWQNRGREARAADSIDRLFEEGVANPPEPRDLPSPDSAGVGGRVVTGGTTTIGGSTVSGNAGTGRD